MDRRRLFWVAVAVAAVAVLALLNRPGDEGEPPAGRGGTPGGQSPPQAVVAHPAGPATSLDTNADGAASPIPTPPPQAEPPHEPSGVTGEQALDPAAAPAALRAAEQFAAIWCTPDPRWYDRLAELATPALAEALAAAEPPATARRIVGGAEVYFGEPEWARIGVPAEAGTVVLDVVAVDGAWLVSAVDWRRS